MANPTPTQIAACRKLGMSDKEIAEMYDDDADVDKGIEMPWDLSKEEHKAAMKRANADEHKKPTAPVILAGSRFAMTMIFLPTSSSGV